MEDLKNIKIMKNFYQFLKNFENKVDFLRAPKVGEHTKHCLLYTSDAADE